MNQSSTAYTPILAGRSYFGMGPLQDSVDVHVLHHSCAEHILQRRGQRSICLHAEAEGQ